MATSGPAAAARVAPAGPTINELLLAFWDHVERHHRRPDGTPTGEVKEYRQAIRVLRRLYGHTPAREFGPVALQTVRAEMIRAAADGGLRWCRSRTNKQVGRVRRCFKWGASQELVPASVWAALGTVAGLRKGRSTARETAPILPVPDAEYAKTLPVMVPTLRAMVELQRHAGLRPGEVRLLTPADLDTAGDLWVYRQWFTVPARYITAITPSPTSNRQGGDAAAAVSTSPRMNARPRLASGLSSTPGSESSSGRGRNTTHFARARVTATLSRLAL